MYDGDQEPELDESDDLEDWVENGVTSGDGSMRWERRRPIWYSAPSLSLSLILSASPQGRCTEMLSTLFTDGSSSPFSSGSG